MLLAFLYIFMNYCAKFAHIETVIENLMITKLYFKASRQFEM